MSVCQLRPTSRGHVRIKSADPLAAPAMQPNYLSTDLDRRCAIAGVKFARKIAATNAMRPYVQDEYRPGPAASSDEDLLQFAREFWRDYFPSVGNVQDGIGTDGRRRRRLCVCMGSPDCAWSTARSCRRWFPATRTRQW